MSFIKSKHSGWTWDLKRTPFGGGGGDPFSQISDTISQGFSDLNLGGSVQPIVNPVLDTVAIATGNPELIPLIHGGNTFAQTGDLGQAALSGGTAYLGGQIGSGLSSLFGDATSSLTDMIGQDAISMQSQGLSAEQIAQNLQQSYGIDQYAAQNAAGIATGGGTAANIASTLAGDYGANMTGVPTSSGGFGIGDILKTAQSGAGIVGGLAKMAGGFGALNAGKVVSPGMADPYAQYRPGNAAQLQNLLNNPNSVAQTPGYQFNLSQGLQAQQAQQAAQGRLVSGGALLQSQNFGQSLANQTYNQQLDTLARLSGAYQAPAAGAGAMQGIGFGNAGSTGLAYNALGGGIGQVGTGLLNLYENYNKPSPNATA
jgi:hypothetical protein